MTGMDKFVNIRIERQVKAALDIYIALEVAKVGRRPTISSVILHLLIEVAPEVVQLAQDARRDADDHTPPSV